jgi:hypothetical protein
MINVQAESITVGFSLRCLPPIIGESLESTDIFYYDSLIVNEIFKYRADEILLLLHIFPFFPFVPYSKKLVIIQLFVGV